MARGTKAWHVYVVRCADGTLYTGVAIDVVRRVIEHNGTRSGGARYTRARRPVTLVYHERRQNRSAASKREFQIKQMSRRQKLALIAMASRIIRPSGNEE